MTEYVCSVLAILADEPTGRCKKTVNRKSIDKHLLHRIKDASATGYVYNQIVFRPDQSQNGVALTPSGTTANEGHHFWLIYNALHKRTQTQYACALRFRLRCALLQKKISQISPQWRLSQQDASSVPAAAFNQNTFRLFDIDEFDPSSLIRGGPIDNADIRRPSQPGKAKSWGIWKKRIVRRESGVRESIPNLQGLGSGCGNFSLPEAKRRHRAKNPKKPETRARYSEAEHS